MRNSLYDEKIQSPSIKGSIAEDMRASYCLVRSKAENPEKLIREDHLVPVKLNGINATETAKVRKDSSIEGFLRRSTPVIDQKTLTAFYFSGKQSDKKTRDSSIMSIEKR